MEIGEDVPDAKTIWLYRNELAKRDLVRTIFAQIEAELTRAGYKAQKGQIIDASIIPVPKQRNTRAENAQVKAGETPELWQENKLAQKDLDARWAKRMA